MIRSMTPMSTASPPFRNEIRGPACIGCSLKAGCGAAAEPSVALLRTPLPSREVERLATIWCLALFASTRATPSRRCQPVTQ